MQRWVGAALLRCIVDPSTPLHHLCDHLFRVYRPEWFTATSRYLVWNIDSRGRLDYAYGPSTFPGMWSERGNGARGNKLLRNQSIIYLFVFLLPPSFLKQSIFFRRSPKPSAAVSAMRSFWATIQGTRSTILHLVKRFLPGGFK